MSNKGTEGNIMPHIVIIALAFGIIIISAGQLKNGRRR
jgi:hypothetical protein